MARKQSEILAEEMEILRAEIRVIEENENATEDDVSRGETLLDEWETKNGLYQKAIDREKRVDDVMRASLNPGNREKAFTAPNVKINRDPFDSDTEFNSLMRSTRHGGGQTVNFDAETTIERAKYAIDQVPRFVPDASKERLHELLEQEHHVHTPLIARHILVTGSPTYRDEFREYATTGHVGEMLRTAMSLTSGNGGYLVPHFLDPTIVLTNAGVYAGTIRGISTVKTIGTTKWEGVTSAGVTAAWVGEGVAASDASPTFTGPSITAQKAVAWLSGSYEVLQDAGFNNDLMMLLADARARLEEADFATANTGATKPRGVVAAVAAVTASIVTAATTNAFVVGDVYSVSNAVNPRQEQNLAWLAHKAIYNKVRQFDTSGGGGFWTNLNFGQPANLLGAPAMKSSAMASAVSTGANVLLAGDFSQYYIVDRIGMSVIYDPLIKTTASGAAPTGQAGWYAFWRTGADVVNADAFRLLQLNQVAAATALA